MWSLGKQIEDAQALEAISLLDEVSGIAGEGIHLASDQNQALDLERADFLEE